MDKKNNNEILDKTPKYTVKEVSKKMGISTYTIRYYDNEGLLPFVSRTDSNIRMFSDDDLDWLKIIHCLRATDLSIKDIKKYIELCLKGDKTIKQRAKIIFAQEHKLKLYMDELQKQMDLLQKKKKYYQNLLNGKKEDVWNPLKKIKRI